MNRTERGRMGKSPATPGTTLLRTMVTRRPIVATIVGFAGGLLAHDYVLGSREKTEDQIIQEYISRIGIKLDAQEQALWDRTNATIRFTKQDVNTATTVNAAQSVVLVLNTMKSSKIEEFKTLGEFFSTMYQTRQMAVSVTPQTDPLENIVHSSVTLEHNPERDQLLETLRTAAPFVLTTTNASTVSLELIQGLQLAYDLSSSPAILASSSAQERYNIMRQEQATNAIKLHARGFGKKVKAYVHMYGLVGNRDITNIPYMKKHAVEFIQRGADENSPTWIEYFTKYLNEEASKHSAPTPLRPRTEV